MRKTILLSVVFSSMVFSAEEFQNEGVFNGIYFLDSENGVFQPCRSEKRYQVHRLKEPFRKQIEEFYSVNSIAQDTPIYIKYEGYKFNSREVVTPFDNTAHITTIVELRRINKNDCSDS